MGTVSISDDEAEIVRSILRRHLPPGVRVFVFGSRAGNRPHKRWSDLDLALEGGRPLSFTEIGLLAEAFDESLLPFKVDLVDRTTVSEFFGKIVDANKVPFPI